MDSSKENMGTYPLLRRSASSALPQGGRPAHPRPCLLELFYRRLDVRDVGVPVLACHTARGPEQEQNRRGALCRQVDGRRDGDGGKEPGPVWVKEIRGGWSGVCGCEVGQGRPLAERLVNLGSALRVGEHRPPRDLVSLLLVPRYLDPSDR